MIRLNPVADTDVHGPWVGAPGHRARPGRARARHGRSARGRSPPAGTTEREPDLVPGDTNNSFDVFVKDRATGAMERVSVDSAGVQGDGWSLAPAMSADGRIVAFHSFAGNLVAGDGNFDFDVFVHDRLAHTTVRASVRTDGTEGDLVPADTGFPVDVFVHDEPR